MAEQQNKKPMNPKVKLVLLYIASFVVSILPLLVILGLRWNSYTETPADTTKLCFGGIIVAVFIALKAIGKLHMPNQVVTFTIVFVLSYLLESVIKDLQILSLMALVGEICDLIFCQKAIKNLKKSITMNEQADIVAERTEQILKKHEGRGG